MQSKNEPVGRGWVIFVAVMFGLAVLMALTGIGFGVYFAWDALCVGLDPNNSTAACQAIN